MDPRQKHRLELLFVAGTVLLIVIVAVAAYVFRPHQQSFTVNDQPPTTTTVPTKNLPVSEHVLTRPLTNGADLDGDGITNDKEKTLGTDPEKRDTDGDKLLDGEEVSAFKTDPLKVDTDGDGVNDGDEVFKGANPLK